MTFLQNWENTLELQVEALLSSFEDNIHGSVVFVRRRHFLVGLTLLRPQVVAWLKALQEQSPNADNMFSFSTTRPPEIR